LVYKNKYFFSFSNLLLEIQLVKVDKNIYKNAKENID